jgi:hypothetical protein
MRRVAPVIGEREAAGVPPYARELERQSQPGFVTPLLASLDCSAGMPSRGMLGV